MSFIKFKFFVRRKDRQSRLRTEDIKNSLLVSVKIAFLSLTKSAEKNL